MRYMMSLRSWHDVLLLKYPIQILRRAVNMIAMAGPKRHVPSE